MGRDPDSGWDDEKERRDQASAEAQRRDEMTIDYSKIKVGDWAAFVVAEVTPDGFTARATGPHSGWVPHSAIVSHTPAPRPALKVGDRVRTPNTANPDREIIWFEGGHVYFRPLGIGHMATQAILSEVETWERV